MQHLRFLVALCPQGVASNILKQVCVIVSLKSDFMGLKILTVFWNEQHTAKSQWSKCNPRDLQALPLTKHTKGNFISIWLHRSIPTFFPLYSRKCPDLLSALTLFCTLLTCFEWISLYIKITLFSL